MLGLGLTTTKVVTSTLIDYFQSTWKTDNAGTSNNNQITLPLESSGTYNFVVDWGDGSSSTITAYNQAEVTHTYASIGTYTVKIIGTCEGWCFNNSGDKLKILGISRWGSLNIGSSTSCFRGCSNLVITALDYLDLTGVTSINYMFRGCTSLNSNPIKFKNTDSLLACTGAFWDCSGFNGDITLPTPNVTSIGTMFFYAGWNKSVAFLTTNNVTNMYAVWYGDDKFNQDISGLNFEKATNMGDMLAYCTAWSRTNYDLALISWANQNVGNGLSFGCSTKYTLGGAAEAARLHLTSVHGWTITDDGGI